MRVVAWLRASQVILFEASFVPAVVGTAAAIAGGVPFVASTFALILASLVSVQWGANLLKGYFEAQGRAVPASSLGSWIAFDSAAATGLTSDPGRILRVGQTFFAVGIVAGLALVALTRNLLLLGFGLAGFALAWSYSSPPLRLSYRGMGEASTFLAFGPIMTVGSAVAYGDRGLGTAALASVVLGLLAAGISFSRYFPNEAEDRAKGKRTPVTILGPRGASAGFAAIEVAAAILPILFVAVDLRLLGGAAAAPFALAASVLLVRAARRGGRLRFGIAFAVLAHAVAGAGFALAFLL